MNLVKVLRAWNLLAERVLEAAKCCYRERLLGFAVFGSVARGVHR